jgi:uncharacterized delta-60 repeat protein
LLPAFIFEGCARYRGYPFAGSAGQIFDSTDFGGIASSIVQPDGKVIFGSNEMSATVPGLGARQIPLIRLNPDGTVDTIYGADNNPDGEGTGIVYVGPGWSEIQALALQPDGKLIAAGVMTGYTEPGTLQNFGGMSIVRFNADGTPDGTFTTRGTVAAGGFDYINDVEVQPDGKIMVAGGFNGIRNANNTLFGRKGIARLNADGSVDTSFAINPADFGAASSQYGFFRDVEISPDGKLYVIGEFFTGFTTDLVVFARLNADGSRDTTFQPVIPADVENLEAVDLDASGRVVMTGSSANLSVGYMQRFFANGAVDSSFNLDPSLTRASNEQLEETATGQYYLATSNLGFADRLVRINSDGSLDPSFNAVSDHPDAPIQASTGRLNRIALAPDGFVYGGATFSSVNGISTRKIVKFEGDFNPTSTGTLFFGGASYSVDEDAGTVTVTVARSGGVNGAASVSYATSNGTAVAGSDYTATSGTLAWAAGEGGLKTFTLSILSDTDVESTETVNLSLNAVTGATLGLSSAVLTINDSDSPPVIVTNPVAQIFVVPNTPLSLSVSATSAALPTTYQWFKGPTLIVGATSTVYTIASAQTTDSDLYSVVVTNPNGTATSTDTDVTVKVPATLAFSSPASVNVIESDGSFQLTLTRADSSVNAVSVDVTALPDTALVGDDFSAFTQTVSWADGDSAPKTITVSLTGDSESESGERFTVALSNWSLDARALPGSRTVVTVFVADDDELATINSISDSLITSAGRTVTLQVAASSQTSLSYQWSRDGEAIVGATNPTLTLSPTTTALAGTYTVAVVNTAGSVTSQPITVQVTPPDFLVGSTMNTFQGLGTITSFAPASNGGIYIGGAFNTVSGQPIATLARIDVNGVLDPSFVSSLSSSEEVSVVRVNNGGDIIVAGLDNHSSTKALDNRLAKFSSTGVLDAAFTANVGSTFDGPILDVAISSDGSIYVVGNFTDWIKKLSPAGVVDSGFAPIILQQGTAFPGLSEVEIIGNSIYVGGSFDNGNGIAYLAKLDANGTIDPSFQNVGTQPVETLFQDNNGNLLFNGVVSGVGSRIQRVSGSGVVDATFVLNVFNAEAAVLGDDSILFAKNGSLRKFANDGTEDSDYSRIAGTAFGGGVSEIGLASDGAA